MKVRISRTSRNGPNGDQLHIKNHRNFFKVKENDLTSLRHLKKNDN